MSGECLQPGETSGAEAVLVKGALDVPHLYFPSNLIVIVETQIREELLELCPKAITVATRVTH